jgi:6-phosphogluconolactonase/glucosamine-6-phosphate isomerase/deaminase
MEYTYSSNPVQSAADHIATAILDKLAANKRVFWFLSGGSGINVVLEVAHQLAGHDLHNLFVTLTDERYGPIGHSNENWQQLLDQGFSLPGATLYRPLIGEDQITTMNHFGAWIAQHMAEAHYSIGLFGIGSDGHTAGIKPHSSAVTANAWTDYFQGDDFERITITPLPISHLNEIVVQASGTDKLPVLQSLFTQSLSVIEQPAQALKSVPRATLYTDNQEVL